MNKITRLNERGLTLIELLAVIVILGIVASIGIIAITTVIQNMKDRSFIGNALAIKEAASFYIRQEAANDKDLPEQLTYKTLVDNHFIEQIKDPDTGNYITPSDQIYVVINKVSVSAVCLKGEKRSLCSFNGKEQAIPIAELSTDLITVN
ncbi:type II secretion system protein [Cytobacillus sp. FJAT-53684]|uniref:Type II secretion system protein n=1 Tax=Cytobacillus mangrovibacter TaxID=3299024 RepID=A0ABW6JY95_9BACI